MEKEDIKHSIESEILGRTEVKARELAQKYMELNGSKDFEPIKDEWKSTGSLPTEHNYYVYNPESCKSWLAKEIKDIDPDLARIFLKEVKEHTVSKRSPILDYEILTETENRADGTVVEHESGNLFKGKRGAEYHKSIETKPEYDNPNSVVFSSTETEMVPERRIYQTGERKFVDVPFGPLNKETKVFEETIEEVLSDMPFGIPERAGEDNAKNMFLFTGKDGITIACKRELDFNKRPLFAENENWSLWHLDKDGTLSMPITQKGKNPDEIKIPLSYMIGPKGIREDMHIGQIAEDGTQICKLASGKNLKFPTQTQGQKDKLAEITAFISEMLPQVIPGTLEQIRNQEAYKKLTLMAEKEEIETSKNTEYEQQIALLKQEMAEMKKEYEQLRASAHETEMTQEKRIKEAEARAERAEENNSILIQERNTTKQTILQIVKRVPFIGKKVSKVFDKNEIGIPENTQPEIKVNEDFLQSVKVDPDKIIQKTRNPNMEIKKDEKGLAVTNPNKEDNGQTR